MYDAWYAKKYANKAGMMHESKGLNVLAKPHPYILILTWMVAVLVVITHDKQGLVKWEPGQT